jgi:hypothetical protein
MAEEGIRHGVAGDGEELANFLPAWHHRAMFRVLTDPSGVLSMSLGALISVSGWIPMIDFRK